MPIKIIASDIDGTLTAPDHQTVTERTRKALQAAHDKGVKIAVATGRTISFISDIIKQIPFIDYVIYSNGASVYDCKAKKNIYENHIPMAAAKRVLEYLDKEKAYYTVYFNGNVYVQKNKIDYYVNHGLPQAFIDSFMLTCNVVDSVLEELKGDNAEIIAVFTDNKDIVSKATDIMRSCNLDIVSSLPNEIEGTVSGADKGAALAGVCRLYNITPNEVMAFGDAGNDCPMLEFAQYSFAMKNGDDLCRKAANYTAESNADDGVAAAVEKYVLQN